MEYFPPSAHDKHIIDGKAGDGVDALGLELIRKLHEAGQMLGIAGRRESSGDREQDYFLALEELIGGHIATTVGCGRLEGPEGIRSPALIVIAVSLKP